MKTLFQPGDQKTFRRLVTPADFAILNGRLIHPLLGTFALGRDMEWTSRLFVEDMLEPGEAGIGTRLEIEHHGPAFAFCTDNAAMIAMSAHFQYEAGDFATQLLSPDPRLKLR